MLLVVAGGTQLCRLVALLLSNVSIVEEFLKVGHMYNLIKEKHDHSYLEERF